jgi:hypothetical protein
LWLSILAYNLRNLWRRLALPGGIEDWSLPSMQQRRIKTGGLLAKHARSYWAMLAESVSDARAVYGDAAADPDSAASGQLTTHREGGSNFKPRMARNIALSDCECNLGHANRFIQVATRVDQS